MKKICVHPCPSVVPKVYKFPRSARFGKMIAKSKIYEHASPTTKVKELFVQEVKKITWSYKLSPETINLPVKDGVQEIQVFTVLLKTGNLSHAVLQTIDKAIPSPILFVVSFEEKIRYVAAYKRPSEADKNKWVVSSYFESADYADERRLEKKELPVVLDMAVLYEVILKNIIDLPARENETLDELVARVDMVRLKEREMVKIQARLKKEKQFNRKVKINAELKKLQQEIAELTQ